MVQDSSASRPVPTDHVQPGFGSRLYTLSADNILEQVQKFAGVHKSNRRHYQNVSEAMLDGSLKEDLPNCISSVHRANNGILVFEITNADVFPEKGEFESFLQSDESYKKISQNYGIVDEYAYQNTFVVLCRKHNRER